MTALLGLNIGGTTCSAVIGDSSGQVRQRLAWDSQAHAGPDAMIDQLLRRARDLLEQAGPIHAVGVAIGGPLDARHGIILSPPNLPGWERIPLTQRIEEGLGVPTRVEHDATACALAEHLWGVGREADRVAYLTCGTGFGVGLVIDGVPYYGTGGAPPEIGHILYREDGPTAHGKRGSFEAFASGASLSRLAAWRYPDRWARNAPSPPQIAELAEQGDEQALAVIQLNAIAVGDAAALLADLLAPQVIAMGSLARYLGSPWLNQVRRRFEQQIGPWLTGHCAVHPAGLGDRLQDCSALAAARSVID